MTDTTRNNDGLLPELDAGPGPALPISDAKAQSMIAAAIGGGVGPGGADGGAASASGSVAAKVALAALVIGAAAVAVVVLRGGGGDGEPSKTREPAAPVAAAPPKVSTDASAAVDPPAPPTTKPSPEEPAPPKKAPPASARTPDDLLRRANQARKRRAWSQANTLYARVWRAHPRSRAAYVARVASAQLNLAKLGRPGVALGLFRRALRQSPSGFLTEEARYGVAQSLRRLGKTSAERGALKVFLRAHPSSPMAARARDRLRAITEEPPR